MLDGPEPIYLQVAQLIRSQVLTGQAVEAERVMSTTELATTFRINPATAAKALALLVDEGVLYKRRGLGMYVAAGARERLVGAHRAAYYSQVLDPALAEADQLGISRNEVAAYVQRASDGTRTLPGASPDDTDTER